MGSDGRACTGATFTHPETESQQLVPALLPGVEAVSRREAYLFVGLRYFKDVYKVSECGQAMSLPEEAFPALVAGSVPGTASLPRMAIPRWASSGPRFGGHSFGPCGA